jgi:hypothetical protein
LSANPAHERGKAVELAKLFAAFPAAREGEMSVKLRVESYAEALAGLPLWAVTEARRDVTGGKFGDGKWCPSSGEFAKLAREKMKPVEGQLALVHRVSNATADGYEPTAEERARVSEGWSELRSELSDAGKAAPPTDPFERLQELAKLAGITVDFDSIPDAPERKSSFKRPSV